MEGRPISKNDIIEPGIIESLTNELRKTQEQLNKGAQETQQNVKKSNSLIYETLEITEDLLRLQKVDLRLKNDIDKLKAKGNDITAKEAALLTQLKEQRKQNNRELNTEARLTKQVGTSMNELSQSLAKNKQAYRALTDEERKNNKIGGQLLKTISKQDKAIKKLDKTLGDNQRNVGNYGSALEGVSGQFGTLGGVLPRVKAGLNFVKIGFKSLRAAVISTGIGALVVAIVSLVQWFKNTATGAKALREIMIPLNAIFETLVGVLKEVGEGLYKLFTGDVSGGIDQITGSVKNLNAEYQRQLNLQIQLAALRNIEEAKYYEDTIKLAQLQRDVAKERLKANDDANYSLEEQIVAIDKAIELTKKMYAIKIDGANRAVAAAVLEADASENSDAANRALADTIAASVTLQADRDNAMRTITRRAVTLNNKYISSQNDVIGKYKALTIVEQKYAQTFQENTGKILESIELRSGAEQRAQDIRQQIFDAETQIQNARLDAANAGFMLFEQLFKEQTAILKILASAQAAINTALAVTQTINNPNPLIPYAVKIAQAIAIGLFGAAQVAKINNVAFADGTESVQGGIKGKDSVNALLMPGERVLTVEQNKQLAGISNNDIPGFVRLGQQSTMVSPELIAIAHAQLSEQRNTNNLLGKWRIVEPDGTMRNLKNDEIKHYIN